MLAAPGQLVKLVVQDLALVQATWPARYQPGVSPVIYNFACEIMGLKKITDRPPTISCGKGLVRTARLSEEVGQEEGLTLARR